MGMIRSYILRRADGVTGKNDKAATMIRCRLFKQFNQTLDLHVGNSHRQGCFPLNLSITCYTLIKSNPDFFIRFNTRTIES